MIISCPSCEKQFSVDESRLAPDGTKVRCSKCSHVWRTAPGGPSAPEAIVTEPSPFVAESPEGELAEKRPEPVLSARASDDSEGAGQGPAARAEGILSAEKEAVGDDGLTAAQHAKLAAMRKKKPRGRRFWFKILAILLIVAGMLWLAYKMMPLADLVKMGEQGAADIGLVEAKPVPADPAKAGHIVGGEPPAAPAK